MSMRDGVETGYETPSEVADLQLEERPDGPAAAAILAAAIGVFTLGLLTVLAEASVGVHDWLEGWEFGQGVGPLAGKTTVSVIVWLVSWIVLAIALRGKDVHLRTWLWLSAILVILGVVGTFPPIFTSFATE